MATDFDQVIDRRNTNAMAKGGFRNYLFGGQDPVVLPCEDDDTISMWVADMAFASAPAARDAMVGRIQSHPIFGYTAALDDQLFAPFAAWCQRHYDWAPKAEHFVTSEGIVAALKDLVEFVLEPGEKVITLTPSYGWFKNSVTHHDHELVTCGLVQDADGYYTIDMDDFAKKVSDPSVRMHFLCHPHNPTGRIWTDDELIAMAEVCLANNVLIVSDEIHCDLLRNGKTHTPLAKLMPDTDQIVTCMSSSKTFNLAGLGLANVIIPNTELREYWIERSSPIINPVSMAAAIGVFSNGDEWLGELKSYLDESFAHAKQRLTAELPAALFNIPDATYLGWIDLTAYFAPGTNLTRYFAESTGVLLEGGDMFVADADGHIRVNFACPRSVLDEGLDRIITATLANVG